jgi:hypothetical protein
VERDTAAFLHPATGSTNNSAAVAARPIVWWLAGIMAVHVVALTLALAGIGHAAVIILLIMRHCM